MIRNNGQRGLLKKIEKVRYNCQRGRLEGSEIGPTYLSTRPVGVK